MAVSLSAKAITDAFCNYILREERRNKVFPNVYLGRWECDILKLTPSDYSTEYEVKTSRVDFFNDFKKEVSNYSREDCGKVVGTSVKHEQIKSGKRTNYFYFVVPDGLVTAEECPEYAGLIYAKQYRLFGSEDSRIYFSMIKSAPRLTKEKFAKESLMDLYNKIYYRFHTLRMDKMKKDESIN